MTLPRQGRWTGTDANRAVTVGRRTSRRRGRDARPDARDAAAAAADREDTVEPCRSCDRSGTPDLRALPPEAAARARRGDPRPLVTSVAKTGGHLGPNLGCVELTIALHRVFDSPREPIVFDTGHQAYVHKMLTGRVEGFERLRQRGGLSGYPSRGRERARLGREHPRLDVAVLRRRAGQGASPSAATRAPVVAVIGDGALTGGMAWEALNNIAAAQDRPVVIVVNDNGRSYSPTIGGVADAPGHPAAAPGLRERAARPVTAGAAPGARSVGSALYDALHAVKKGLKDVLVAAGRCSRTSA